MAHFADGDAIWAAWSPSGNQIAFERDVYTGAFVTRGAIYTINADGSGLRPLVAKGLNGEPSWSPNGKLIVYGSLQFGKRASLSVIAANGSRVRTVLTTPLPCKRFCGIGFLSPTFSPDGKRTAFAWHKGNTAAIFTMKAGGGGLRQVTPWEKGGLADKIDWSPDGARIAFSSPGIGDLPGVSSNVFTVRTDGTGLAKLTHSTGGKVNNGLDSWSPDGNGVSQITHGNESHRGAWGTHP